MHQYHRLLNRQIRKYLPDDPELLNQLAGFIQSINEAYLQSDADRMMLERSLDLSSGELVKANSEMRAIFQAFPDLFFLVNGNGIILEQRGGQAEDLILEGTKLIGKSIFSGPDPLVNSRFLDIFNKVREFGTVQNLEYALFLHGSHKYFEARFVPLPTSNVIIIVRNITERKKLESQFLRTQRMESIGTLAGGMAHDLNNVFAPLALSVDLLKTKSPDEKSMKILQTMEESIRRGADMIRQVLAFARGVEGNHKPLSPNRVLTEVIRIMEDTFPKQIKIHTEIQQNLPSVSGDETQIHQVILNICVNARDVMPKGGALKIQSKKMHVEHPPLDSVMKPGDYVVTTITDTGPGIPSAIIDKIFEPFFTTKDVGKGTGLGLSTALSIVRSHGGHINVYSIENRGTSFSIYIPVETSGSLQEMIITPADMVPGNGEWILIIDDEAPIRMIAEQTLTSYNYQIMSASNGFEGVHLFKQHQDKISLVISDMMMPEMDGIETIRQIRKISPSIPILGTSGLSSYNQVSDLTGEHVSFLSKPYSSYELLAEINALLRKL